MSRLLRCALLVLGPAAVTTPTAGQEVDTARERLPFLLGVNGHAGFIIPHTQELVDVSGSHPFGLEVELAWLMAGKEHTYRNGLVAKRGFSLRLIDFGDPKVLGHVFSITPYIEPMIRAQDRLHGSVRLGAGVGLLDQPYDPESNPKNLFYSSPVSFTAMVGARLGYRTGPSWEFTGGFDFNHVSNAGMRQPNKGINYPTWNVGVVHSFRPLHIERPVRDDAWRTAPRWSRRVLLSASVKTAPAGDDAQQQVVCPIAGVMGLMGWRAGRLTTLSGGTEWVYDDYAQELCATTGRSVSGWQGALVLGPGACSGRVRMDLLFGIYALAPSWSGDPVYQRYQLSFDLGRGMMIGTSLKAHRHVADVIDLRLGWSW